MEGQQNIIGIILERLGEEMETAEHLEETTRATSSEFIDSLKETTIDKSNISCSICLEEFEIGEKCIKLPCKGNGHFFHNEKDNCMGIKKWLEKSNTCPVCRAEFPKERSDTQDIIRDIDNRVQFILNGALNQRIRLLSPQEMIEMEEQRQLDVAIRSSLEER